MKISTNLPYKFHPYIPRTKPTLINPYHSPTLKHLNKPKLKSTSDPISNIQHPEYTLQYQIEADPSSTKVQHRRNTTMRSLVGVPCPLCRSQ